MSGVEASGQLKKGRGAAEIGKRDEPPLCIGLAGALSYTFIEKGFAACHVFATANLLLHFFAAH